MDPSDFERLQRLLDEANQRADEAERNRQEERDRAERQQQRAEREQQRAENAERNIEREQQQTRPTTLTEYITACHTSVFAKLAVQTNRALTSKGSITNPQNKYCPTNLQPWSGFLDKQRTIFGTIYETFPSERRVFENQNFLAGLGDRVSKRSIGDEKSLENFLHISVEDPVRNIIERLKEVPDVSDAFDLGNGVIFENHPHAISDVAEEVADREAPSTPPQTPGQTRDLNQLRADQICIYRSDDGRLRTMIYISEYKPPHKLTTPHLRRGLRPMNIWKEVVNRKTIPTTADPDAQFKYFAERLTASALTQTYHYMIQGGLEYSLLTTGEAIVFLKIDWEDTGTLYYHLAEPGPEVSAHPANMHLCTAVGQYLAFTLLALGQPGARREHGQAERERAKQNLKTWAVDFETTLRSTSESDRITASEGSLALEPTTYENWDRSPLMNRLRNPRVQCNDDQQQADDQPEPSDDESAKGPETPSPAVRRSNRLALRRRDAGAAGAGDAGARDASAQEQGYCTQKCLLGLVGGKDLDPKCPNLKLHREHGATEQTRHPVTHTKWLIMLQDQLRKSLDDGIVRLQLGGARGVLFKVTLLAYGYTFISKGTVRAFIKDLEYEAEVYNRLRPIQGINVPVFLGAIDLRPMNKIYYYDHRVYVVHMTFLSWGGCRVLDAEANGESRQSLQQHAIQSVRAIHRQRILHNDTRAANMLFNREVNRVMVVDFERATLLLPLRAALAPASPNKRGRDPEKLASGSGKRLKRLEENIRMEEDVWTVEQAFVL